MSELENTIIEEPKQPPAANNTRLLVFLGIGAIIFFCACISCCVLVFGSAFLTVEREREPVMQVLDEFMGQMEAEDFDAAYDLFSTRAQMNVPFTELENMGMDANVVLFDGYQSLEIININLTQSVHTNQTLPQGRVANVNGIVAYVNGIQGSFTATLEKENDMWRLHAINVTVPPEKFEDYYDNNP